MATKEKTEVSQDQYALREKTALEIYLRKLSTSRRGIDPKIVAAEAFREAKAFCEVAGNFRDYGEDAIEEVLPPDDGLDFASAPNLPDDHPFNLGSRRFGNAETLATLTKLKAKPEAFRKACNNVTARN